MNFDELVTSTSREQADLERSVAQIASRHAEEGGPLLLDRQRHIVYLQKGLKSLPESFTSLESSRPWILFWITHSLALLGAELPENVSVQGICAILQCSQLLSAVSCVWQSTY